MMDKEDPVVSSRPPHFADHDVPSSAGDCWEDDNPVLTVTAGVDQDAFLPPPLLQQRDDDEDPQSRYQPVILELTAALKRRANQPSFSGG
jgi:hypothetical protein